MKKLTTLLMTLMLMSTALWADETITVSANNSDISEGLDLKVVAKLFAEAKNLEEFENMLNNPDSAFCNLDLNGDGQVDYLRVIETGSGNKRLVVLQAVLATDIYQDVASIYVEKDANDEVSVQVVGDEYVYGTNYIIEPVYVYRPVIYDWFWCDAWYAWHSPWYWGYYPSWWYVHNCWAHDWYWHHCYAYHHHHYCCSFRYAHDVRPGYHDLHHGVSHRDYAVTHPDHSFVRRNAGYTNAREIRSVHTTPRRDAVSRPSVQNRSANAQTNRTAPTRSTSSVNRPTTATTTRSTNTSTRSTNTSSRSTATATRSTSSSIRQPQRPAGSTSTSSTTRSTSSSSTSRSTSTSSTTRTSSGPSRTSSSTYSGSSYGGGRSSGGGGYSGGSHGGGGGGSRGGSAPSGGGGRTRR